MGFIRQLTGVRFFAAFWVLLYHYQPAFAQAGILFPVVHDVLRVGSLGVDLFFMLSGFILTYTYLHKLGPALKGRAAGHFYWLRFARIYPVHFVMLIIAGLAVLAASIAGQDADKSWLNPWAFIKQLLLIQEWGPNPDRGWNFVAWSLSMEALAYLLFPLMALVLWRLRDRLPAWGLALCGLACMLPWLIIGLTANNFYMDDAFLVGGWRSTYRILTEFLCGAFVYLVVRKLSENGGPSRLVKRYSRILTWAIPVAIVGISVTLGQISALQWANPGAGDQAPKLYAIIIPFLAVWIGALAMATGGPVALLSHPKVVLGGFISYSLYMVHLVWYGLWRNGMKAVGVDGGPLYLISTVVLVVMAVVFAYLMWRFVEEPAREWLRKRIGAPPVPIEEAAVDVRGNDEVTAKPERANES